MDIEKEQIGIINQNKKLEEERVKLEQQAQMLQARHRQVIAEMQRLNIKYDVLEEMKEGDDARE